MTGYADTTYFEDGSCALTCPQAVSTAAVSFAVAVEVFAGVQFRAGAGRCYNRMRRWLPDRELVVVGDRTYATLKLLAACQGMTPPVTFLTRLRGRVACWPAMRLPPVPTHGDA